jgi:hypothetical protein
VSALPERPFVPHRTPKPARSVAAQFEFRLSRPFVPGSGVAEVGVSGTNDAAFVAELATTRPDVAADLPPIQEFLGGRDASSVERTRAPIEATFESEALEGADDLPPIEHFIDPLPVVDAFAPADEQIYGAQATPLADYAQQSDGATGAGRAEAEWGETDWQQYDWRSAAALGESGSPEDEASLAWAATDWEGRLPVSRARPGARGTADAIATALDEIAQRIRNGDLSLPSAAKVTDPAAIAAALAALLGVKR